jgi:thioredoxin
VEFIMTAASKPAAPPVPVLTSAVDVEAALNTDLPVLLLAWQDKSPRRDVEIALAEAAQQHRGRLEAFIVDAREQPDLAARFDLGSKPVLIGWFEGEARIRRNKPWNTDVTGIATDLLAFLPEEAVPEEDEAQAPAADEPVHVTDQTFMHEVMESPLPVVIDFWADWCQPCKMVAPILEKLAKEYAGRVRIAKVDVDANPILSTQFQVQSIPTLMFVKNGKIVGRSAGAAPEPAIRDVIEQLIALQV